MLPFPLAPALYPRDLALALLYGLLTAVAFALWPLGRAHDVAGSVLFRDEVATERRWPRRPYIVATALVGGALAVLAIELAYERRIAAIFVAAAVAVFVLLYCVATLLMRIARNLPRLGSPLARLAIANIHRPGALTPSVVLSLGLGLALLVTVITIDGNLRRQFTAAMPDKAPSFFFVDIPANEAAKFDAFVHEHAPHARLERVPMLRGRIVAANGVPAEDLRPPPDVAWALQSDRGLTYSDRIPAGSRVVAGDWWKPGDGGPALVSFEKRIADGLGLGIGDPVIVNVLGRNLTATVANLREVDWQSLGINFVMVFSPATLRGAPHTDIATLTYPGGGSAEQEVALLKAVAEAYPAVTAVRVRDALDAIGQIVGNLVMAIRAASALTLLVAVLRGTNACGCLGHHHPAGAEGRLARRLASDTGHDVGEIDLAIEAIRKWEPLPLAAIEAQEARRDLGDSSLTEFGYFRFHAAVLSIFLHELEHLAFPSRPESVIRQRSNEFYLAAVQDFAAREFGSVFGIRSLSLDEER